MQIQHPERPTEKNNAQWKYEILFTSVQTDGNKHSFIAHRCSHCQSPHTNLSISFGDDDCFERTENEERKKTEHETEEQSRAGKKLRCNLCICTRCGRCHVISVNLHGNSTSACNNGKRGSARKEKLNRTKITQHVQSASPFTPRTNQTHQPSVRVRPYLHCFSDKSHRKKGACYRCVIYAFDWRCRHLPFTASRTFSAADSTMCLHSVFELFRWTRLPPSRLVSLEYRNYNSDRIQLDVRMSANRSFRLFSGYPHSLLCEIIPMCAAVFNW